MKRGHHIQEGRSTLVLDFDFSDGFSAENAAFSLRNRFGDDIDLNFKGTTQKKDFQVTLDASRWALAKLIIKFLVKGPYNVAKYVVKKVLFGGPGKTETIIREVTIGDNAYKVMQEALREDPDLREAQWSAPVTKSAKYHPPEGLFDKSASAIASQLASDSKDLKQAMSRLNFYINRAGSNLSSERKSELEKAKELLHKKMGGA